MSALYFLFLFFSFVVLGGTFLFLLAMAIASIFLQENLFKEYLGDFFENEEDKD